MKTRAPILALSLAVNLLSFLFVSAAAAASPWTDAQIKRGVAVFQHHSINLVERDFVPPAADGKISCTLAKGEYEPVQIAVRALALGGIKNVRLAVESDFDVRIFRRIDGEVRKLLTSYSNPVPPGLQNYCLDESAVISGIDGEANDFFWLTVHAGSSIEAGVHHGKLRFTAERGGESLAVEREIEINVHPFSLHRPRISYFPFYYIDWWQGPPPFTHNETWVKQIYRDMAEHGSTSVTFYGFPQGGNVDLSKSLPPPENAYTSTLIPAAIELGLLSPDVPAVSWVHSYGPLPSEGGPSVEEKNRAADWWENERMQRGWPEMLLYNFDEPSYPNNQYQDKMEKHMRVMRDVRVRHIAAIGSRGVYGYGDLFDVWVVYAGGITPAMNAEADYLGAEVWTYSCHLYPGESIKERYYAGYYVWANKLKGHTTWHHYAQGGYKCVWMREGDKGPMPTIGWESRREGIDDYRYMTLLEDSIAARPNNVVAYEAAGWLAAVRTRIVVDPHKVAEDKPLGVAEYDAIRAKAADYITRLGAPPQRPISARPRGSGLKDEARRFRNKTLDTCIAALSDHDVMVRRAAALALRERGTAAAPATAALAAQLETPEVRMPALRALEAIGPAAVAAIPKIAALYSSSDSFVRLGATMALRKMGAPAAASLQVALIDDDKHVAEIAGMALKEYGPASVSALPTLIKMLDGSREARGVALMVIRGIGPGAAPAAPKIIETWPDWYLSGYSYYIPALVAIGRPAAEGAIPLIEKLARKEAVPLGPEGDVYGNHDVLAEAHHALFVFTGKTEHLEALLQLVSDRINGGTAVRRLCDLGRAAVEIVPEARRILDEGAINIKRDGRVKLLEEFIVIATE